MALEVFHVSANLRVLSPAPECDILSDQLAQNFPFSPPSAVLRFGESLLGSTDGSVVRPLIS